MREQDAALPEDFDRIAVVVDWLDACRTRDLDALLDLYAADASMECKCDSVTFIAAGPNWMPTGGPGWTARSRSPLASKKSRPRSTASCSTIAVMKGKPVRIHFSFDKFGKIVQTRCGPVGTLPSGAGLALGAETNRRNAHRSKSRRHALLRVPAPWRWLRDHRCSQRRRLDDMVAVSDFVNAIFHHLKIRSRQIACRHSKKSPCPPGNDGFHEPIPNSSREQPAIRSVSIDKTEAT